MRIQYYRWHKTSPPVTYGCVRYDSTGRTKVVVYDDDDYIIYDENLQ